MKRPQIRFIMSFAIALAGALCSSSHGAPPLTTEFAYQGELRAAGVPATGLYDMQFTLYDAAADGDAVGGPVCVDNVGLNSGRFTVNLDFGAVFQGQAFFLQIEVRPDTGLDCSNLAGFTVLTPRQYLAGAPNAQFALTAAGATNATQLNGQSAPFYLNAANLSTGTLADARLTRNVSLLGSSQTFTGAKTFSAAPAFTAAGAPFSVANSTLVPNLNADLLDGLNSTAFLQGIPNPLTLVGANPLGGVLNVTNSAGPAIGASSSGDFSGLDAFTSGATAQAVFGRATHTTGANRGGWFQSFSSAGIGVEGLATATSGVNCGVYGESASYFGYGVRGVANAADDKASSAGVYGSSSGQGGTGVLGLVSGLNGSGVVGVTTGEGYSVGVWGTAQGSAGLKIGVAGFSTADAGYGVQGGNYSNSGTTFGVVGEVHSPDGRGVYGYANSSSGNTRGVYGITDSASGGRGVQGYATSTAGTTYGVLGRTDSAGGYGVYGQTVPTTGTNYAVFASGNTGASGTKSFRIDHPDDPANKYLLHYSVESPEVINSYSGKVMLDGAGEAVVELPAYFAKINKDPRYLLTPIGAAMPNLHVADEIDERLLEIGALAQPAQVVPPCRFRIAGGVAGAKVSWRVEALRNDRYVQRYGAPVEVDKQNIELGAYQHPELYGRPAEMGLNYQEPQPRIESIHMDEVNRLR